MYKFISMAQARKLFINGFEVGFCEDAIFSLNSTCFAISGATSKRKRRNSFKDITFEAKYFIIMEG